MIRQIILNTLFYDCILKRTLILNMYLYDIGTARTQK